MTSEIRSLRFPINSDLTGVSVEALYAHVGDYVRAGSALMHLGYDGGSMRVNSNYPGQVVANKVAVGDPVLPGTILISIEVADFPPEPDVEPAPKNAVDVSLAGKAEQAAQETTYDGTLKPWEVWFDRLIRWPLSFCFALLSFALLVPYSGKTFWVLLGAHSVIAVTVGVVIVRFFGKRIFLPADETVSRLFLFLTLVGIMHVGGIGQMLVAPVQAPVSAVAAPIMSAQRSLVGDGDGSTVLATRSSSGQMAGFAGRLLDLPRRGFDMAGDYWRNRTYRGLDDGGWDDTPMEGRALLDAFAYANLDPGSFQEGLFAVLTVANNSNVSVRILTAELKIGSLDLGKIDFYTSNPVVPGTTGDLYYKLTPPFDSTAIIWSDNRPYWVAGDLKLVPRSANTEPFSRQAYFEGNVASWLDE